MTDDDHEALEMNLKEAILLDELRSSRKVNGCQCNVATASTVRKSLKSWSQPRLHGWLERQHLDSGGSKREMLGRIVDKMVEDGPCMYQELCPCRQAGVECHFWLCNCCSFEHTQHVHAAGDAACGEHGDSGGGDGTGNGNGSPEVGAAVAVTVMSICANPVGSCLFDGEAVERYRAQFLEPVAT